MMRLQDIADKAGVSRTTVSNVLHGKTKKVSQETADRVRRILIEENYLPSSAAEPLGEPRTICFVLGYRNSHGMDVLRDPYVSELLSIVEREASQRGYHVLLVDGEDYRTVVEIASKWNVEGLILFGYPLDRYRLIRKRLNKKMLLLDAYPEGGYDFQNVGIDDYSGGYQVGAYLKQCGFTNALYVAESRGSIDFTRWRGFKAAMEEDGHYCSKSRYILVSSRTGMRLQEYETLLPVFLKAGALAFPSDYAAIEAMKFFQDHGLAVPKQISIVGNDDSLYAQMVTPRLTTVRQNVEEKAVVALDRLMRMIQGEQLSEFNVQIPVELVIRDSVRDLHTSA